MLMSHELQKMEVKDENFDFSPFRSFFVVKLKVSSVFINKHAAWHNF